MNEILNIIITHFAEMSREEIIGNSIVSFATVVVYIVVASLGKSFGRFIREDLGID